LLFKIKKGGEILESSDGGVCMCERKLQGKRKEVGFMSIDTFIPQELNKKLMYEAWANEYLTITGANPKISNYDNLIESIKSTTLGRLDEIHSFRDLDIILDEEIQNTLLCGPEAIYESVKSDVWIKLKELLKSSQF
jgi:hypothetical protein